MRGCGCGCARAGAPARGHLERARCRLCERGGKYYSASLNRYMRGRIVYVRKLRETVSRSGARARAGRLEGGGMVPWECSCLQRKEPCPWSLHLPPLPPAVPGVRQQRVCGRERACGTRVRVCARLRAGAGGVARAEGVTSTARGAGRASGEERARVRAWTDTWEGGASAGESGGRESGGGARVRVCGEDSAPWRGLRRRRRGPCPW